MKEDNRRGKRTMPMKMLPCAASAWPPLHHGPRGSHQCRRNMTGRADDLPSEIINDILQPDTRQLISNLLQQGEANTPTRRKMSDTNSITAK